MADARSGRLLQVSSAIGATLAVIAMGCVPSAVERVTVPTTDYWKEVVAGDGGGAVSPRYPLDVTADMVEYARTAAGGGKPAREVAGAAGPPV